MVTLSVATVTGALATPAIASTVTAPTGQSLSVDAAALEANEIVVSQAGGTVTITDVAGITEAIAACSQDSPTQVSCATPSAIVHVQAGDLNDKVSVSFATLMQAGASGGDGDDLIDGSGTGTAVSLMLTGDSGDDRVVGGAGLDFLDVPSYGGGGFKGSAVADVGDDQLEGGAGHDYVIAGVGADRVDGGEGGDYLIGARNPEPGPLTQPGFPEDGAVDEINCGGNAGDSLGGDTVYTGVGDRIGIDCENIQQLVICPQGADCQGETTVTAPAATGAASAARGKKGKLVVLGKSRRKLKLRAGQSTVGGAVMSRKAVRKTLGKRSQLSATMQLGVRRIRNGREVGRTKRKVRFKLRKR